MLVLKYFLFCTALTFNNLLMNKVIIALLLLSNIVFSQQKSRVETYNYGQSGMELIAKSKKGMVIVSTHNAKMTIREEIARKIYDLYADNKLVDNQKIIIAGNCVNVTGKCVIRKKNNLISVDFYYETVEWENGLTEIYLNLLG